MTPQAARAPVAIMWPDAMAMLASVLPMARAAAGQLDLTALTRFDSSALAVLLAVRRECGPATRFLHPAPGLRALAALYGVEALLFAPQAQEPSRS